MKDIGGDYLRGRASGEVAAILFGALRAAGLPAGALPVCLDEAQAACEALQWARPGGLAGGARARGRLSARDRGGLD